MRVYMRMGIILNSIVFLRLPQEPNGKDSYLLAFT